jgi:hypothetical protein
MLLYEKPFTSVMLRNEENPGNISADDVQTIAYIVANISAKMNKIMKTYSDPKEYAKKVLKLLKHKKNILGVLIFYNLINMDPEQWHSPDDFKKKVTETLRDETTYDVSSILSGMEEKDVKMDDYINPKEINKALTVLKKEFKIIHVKNKKEIEQIIGKKIKELEGRPSFYKLASDSINLKKVMSNPIHVELIISSLKRLGLVRFLSLILEAELYVLRKNKEVSYELAKAYMKSNQQVIKVLDWKHIQSSVNDTISLLDSINEDQLKILCKKIASLMVEHPFFYPYILSMALSRTS